MKNRNIPNLAAVLLAGFMGAGFTAAGLALAGVFAPAPDPHRVRAVSMASIELQVDMDSYRNLTATLAAGIARFRQQLERPDSAVNEGDVVRILCVGQAGLAKHGDKLGAAVEDLRAGIAELDDKIVSGVLVPIADEAEALRERMAAVEQDAGEYAKRLAGAECTGDETLPEGRKFPETRAT